MKAVEGTHGVVVGGGVAGMLAAAALARCVDRVTVLDRDRIPDRPDPRPGVPQSRHAHVLMSGGARAIDALLPSTVDALVDAGARRLGMPDDVATLTPFGWLPPSGRPQYLVAGSRDLLDFTLRHRLLRDRRVSLRCRTEVTGLLGNARRVAGVRLRDRDTGAALDLAADVTVLAPGAAASVPHWLDRLGVPEAEEEVVDSGLAYATRVYRAPEPHRDRAVAVNIQLDPCADGQGGVILPIEGDRWIVTMLGLRGCQPPTDAEGFEAFADNLRHPLIGRLLARAAPEGPVRGFRATSNRRRRFERVTRWPAGLIVLGDAACAFNPSYGHGMSVAALGARALAETLGGTGTDATGGADASARAQRAVARSAEGAWSIATGQDLRRPETTGHHPGGAARLLNRYLDRVATVALTRPPVLRSMLDVYTLSAPPTRLLAPATIGAALRGPDPARPRWTPPGPDELLPPATTAPATPASSH